DLGCGRGVHTEPLMRLGFDVYACDRSPKAVEAVRSLLADIVGAAEAKKRCSESRLDALGYPDDYFDWVVAFDTLARVESDRDMLEMLDEVRRVMKSGGWIYVAVPAVPDAEAGLGAADRGYAGDSGMAPTFMPRTLDDVLVRAGFTVSERPSIAARNDGRVVRAIYRKVDEQTPV
ncbi:MAG: class I SAM-dependent methyltransferase, partial [Rhodothermales bacterium]